MLRVLCLALLIAPAGFGADISGIWTGRIQVRNGYVDVAFKLTQTGSKISGKMYGEYLSSPIVEGTVSGDDVEFVVLSQEQAGNEINQTQLRFKGGLRGPDLELTRERISSTRAGSSGGVQNRNNTAVTFCLHRLF